jgi:hypothetical protein
VVRRFCRRGNPHRYHSKCVGQALGRHEGAIVALDAHIRAFQPLGSRGGFRHRLQRMERPASGSSLLQRKQGFPVEQAGEMQDHLITGDGSFSRKLARDRPDCIVGRGNEDQFGIRRGFSPAALVEHQWRCYIAGGASDQRDLVASPLQGQAETLTHPSRPDDGYAWLRHQERSLRCTYSKRASPAGQVGRPGSQT